MAVVVFGLSKNKMKIIEIKGGLGNQMFQYAYGRKLESAGQKIAFDISFFNGNKSKKDAIRDFKLGYFNLGTKAVFTNQYSPVSKILNKIKRNLGLDVNGFYQSEKYFSDIANVIRQDFKLRQKMSPSAEMVLESIKKSEVPISIHIRRGDYVKDKKTNRYHGSLPTEYYKKALAILSEKLGAEKVENKDKIKFFIFSDDIEWVKQNMTFPYQAIFVSNPAIPDYEELVLMSSCQHHIIANSSFSWWGAWLGPNPQKIVIAPEKWFNTKPGTYQDIVPNSWIKI